MNVAFERFVVSGACAMHGASMNGHVATLAAQKLTKSDGTIVYAHALDGKLPHVVETTSLEPCSRVHRVWKCAHADTFLRIFRLDVWRHHEVVKKDEAGNLEVIDKLEWHRGKSTAQRKYRLSVSQTGALDRKVGRWHLNMAGIHWVVRSKVESAMRVQLPRATERTWEALLTSRSLD